MTTQAANGFCDKCGAPLHADSAFCPRCGAAVITSAASPSTTASSTYGAGPQPSWREQRRRERAERRSQQGRSGFGGLVIASILIVAGLGIYFPSLPWEVFWGGLLILLGVWVAFGWSRRVRTTSIPQNSEQPR